MVKYLISRKHVFHVKKTHQNCVKTTCKFTDVMHVTFVIYKVNIVNVYKFIYSIQIWL